MMTPFRAFQLYIAVKLHFTREGYDCVKYNFKTSSSESAYVKRADQWYFHKVAKKYSREKNAVHFYVANFIADNTWVGDMLEHDPDVYTEWEGRYERRVFAFEKEIRTLLREEKPFNETFIGDGDIPLIIRRLYQGSVSFETVAILDKLINNIDKVTTPDLLWPETRVKIKKYQSFLPVDQKKIFATFEKLIRDAYK